MDNRPPPPPHGNNTNGANKKSGLPDGNYDIFIIPPHSSGGGFLYLPSLQPHRNSFLAGVACTLAAVGIWTVVVPILKEWFATIASSGGPGVLLLLAVVAVAAWAIGKTQTEAEAGGRKPPPTPDPSGAGTFPNANGFTPGPSPFAGANGSTPSGSNPFAGTNGSTPFGATPKPQPSWQQSAGSSASSNWQKAREETKKREEEKRKKEEAEKKKQDAEKKAKEAAEKEKWEKARAREREAREKEAREKIAQERIKKEQEAKAAAKAAAEPPAGSGLGAKNYQKPTAQSFAGDEDEYSFRPYDAPKVPRRPVPKGSQGSFVSEGASSWGGSQSTSKTTPPPSQRGPYSTKDENKIQIKAVYAFTDLSPKPALQLIAGFGNVTDGLVLKMTTEGLFIDDDVRGVGQREWDVKAWTLKLVEVWCTQFAARCGPATPARYALKQKEPGQRFFSASGNGAFSSKNNLTSEELDLILVDLLRTCRNCCLLQNDSQSNADNGSSIQTGDLKSFHVLRACIRDADNKKYVFIIDSSEAWKVALGLQRLRRGSQVRSLGVSGLPSSEANRILSTLGWT